ncbi:MAG: hypothetical protein WC130_10675 [Kiritimatiellia bacterium]
MNPSRIKNAFYAYVAMSYALNKKPPEWALLGAALLAVGDFIWAMVPEPETTPENNQGMGASNNRMIK